MSAWTNRCQSRPRGIGLGCTGLAASLLGAPMPFVGMMLQSMIDHDPGIGVMLFYPELGIDETLMPDIAASVSRAHRAGHFT